MFIHRGYLIIRALFNALYDLMQRVVLSTIACALNVTQGESDFFLCVKALLFFLWFLTREGAKFITVIVSLSGVRHPLQGPCTQEGLVMGN